MHAPVAWFSITSTLIVVPATLVPEYFTDIISTYFGAAEGTGPLSCIVSVFGAGLAHGMPARQKHLDFSIFAAVTLQLGLPVIELQVDVLLVVLCVQGATAHPRLESTNIRSVRSLASLIPF